MDTLAERILLISLAQLDAEKAKVQAQIDHIIRALARG